MPACFVLCPSYHGLTLLTILLHNHSQVSCPGAFRPPEPGLTCSCGEPTERCGFWSEVRARVGAHRFPPGQAGPWILPGRGRLPKSAWVDQKLGAVLYRAGLRAGPGVWRLAPGRRRRYVEAHQAFAEAVTGVQGTERFVAAQVELRHVLVLRSMLPTAQPFRLVQLVRDPRGYVNSVRKHQPPEAEPQFRWWWSQVHGKLDALRRDPPRGVVVERVRYEDLCAEPEPTLRRVLEFFELPWEEDLFRSPQGAEHYHMLGNRMLSVFDGRIRVDEAWRTKLDPREQAEILAEAQPLAGAFGYGA